MARAPVSKTGGCRFESCHSCQQNQQLRARVVRKRARATARGNAGGNKWHPVGGASGIVPVFQR
jgi:hypothetical protein